MAKSSKIPMTKTAAARIQSAEARANGGKVGMVQFKVTLNVLRLESKPSCLGIPTLF
jgi:hypothetical protein